MIPSEKSVKYVMSAHRNMPLSLNMSVMRSMKLGREGLAWRNRMGSWDAVVPAYRVVLENFVAVRFYTDFRMELRLDCL